jgi:hypothetical protein
MQSERRSRGLVFVAIGAALLGAACGHSKSVADGKPEGKDESKREGKDESKGEARSERKSTASERREEGRGGSAEEREARGAQQTAGDGETPIASRPAGLLAEGAEAKIQQRLGDKGLLEGRPSGALDDRTRAALRRFQKDEKLPETGVPDQETITRLGLEPDQIFRRAP